MQSKLINYFRKIMPLSEEEIETIINTMSIREYKKGKVLLKEGQISDETYFVSEGCVRQFYLVDGEGKTQNFFTDKQWVVSIKSFSQNIPSAHFLDCCTDVILVVGNREKGGTFTGGSQNLKRFPAR